MVCIWGIRGFSPFHSKRNVSIFYVDQAGAGDLGKFFVAVIPEATNIIAPIVEKHGYPPTQEGEKNDLQVSVSKKILLHVPGLWHENSFACTRPLAACDLCVTYRCADNHITVTCPYTDNHMEWQVHQHLLSP